MPDRARLILSVQHPRLAFHGQNATLSISQSCHQVGQVAYGVLTFASETRPTVPVFIRDGKVVEEGPASAFDLYARPVPGAVPLFLIENGSGETQKISGGSNLNWLPLAADIDEIAEAHDYIVPRRLYFAEQGFQCVYASMNVTDGDAAAWLFCHEFDVV